MTSSSVGSSDQHRRLLPVFRAQILICRLGKRDPIPMFSVVCSGKKSVEDFGFLEEDLNRTLGVVEAGKVGASVVVVAVAVVVVVRVVVGLLKTKGGRVVTSLSRI